MLWPVIASAHTPFLGSFLCPPTPEMASCTPSQLASVLELVQDSTTAQAVCDRFNVGSLGAQAAVISYLSRRSQQSTNSLNIQFLLFSAYLVFIMQSGFAMVRPAGDAVQKCRSAVDQCSGGPKIEGSVWDARGVQPSS